MVCSLRAVRHPARFTVFEIGSDYVLGKRLDDLDVEHEQLLRFYRGAPQASRPGLGHRFGLGGAAE